MKSPRLIYPLVFAALLSWAVPTLHAARQDGLVLYMNFDDETVRDDDENSGPLRNLAPKSEIQAKKVGEALEPSLTTGRFGKAAEFKNTRDGKRIDDWAISLGKLESVYAGSFSVACWVRYPNSHKAAILANKELLNKFSPGILLSTESERNVHVSAVGQPAFEAKGGDSRRLSDDRWHHWALVVDRDSARISFYLDGTLISKSEMKDPTASLDGGRATFVGAAADEKNGASKVALDDLGIWNRALSESEIKALGFGVGKRIPEPSAYAWAGLASAAGVLAWRRRRRAK